MGFYSSAAAVGTLHETVSSGHGEVVTAGVFFVSSCSCMPGGVIQVQHVPALQIKCNGPKPIGRQLKGH